MATFKNFIKDARQETLDGGCDLIGGFYKILSQDQWDVGDLIAYIEGKGYKVTVKDLVSLDSLHDKACEDWEFVNKDY